MKNEVKRSPQKKKKEKVKKDFYSEKERRCVSTRHKTMLGYTNLLFFLCYNELCVYTKFFEKKMLTVKFFTVLQKTSIIDKRFTPLVK